jgi:hypothetical protein
VFINVNVVYHECAPSRERFTNHLHTACCTFCNPRRLRWQQFPTVTTVARRGNHPPTPRRGFPWNLASSPPRLCQIFSKKETPRHTSSVRIRSLG